MKLAVKCCIHTTVIVGFYISDKIYCSYSTTMDMATSGKGEPHNLKDFESTLEKNEKDSTKKDFSIKKQISKMVPFLWMLFLILYHFLSLGGQGTRFPFSVSQHNCLCRLCASHTNKCPQPETQPIETAKLQQNCTEDMHLSAVIACWNYL